MKVRASHMMEPGRVVYEEFAVRPPAEAELLVRSQQASICGSDLERSDDARRLSLGCA